MLLYYDSQLSILVSKKHYLRVIHNSVEVLHKKNFGVHHMDLNFLNFMVWGRVFGQKYRVRARGLAALCSCLCILNLKNLQKVPIN